MTTLVSGDSGGTAVTTTTLPTLIPGFLFGLTLSTAGSSATFSIASGAAVNSLATGYMTLASAYTKTTSAWALGSAAGALDTGAIANSTWYHVYLIQRVDTGVVDVLISLSATAPTMPTNYTLFRRIGSMLTNGSAQWVKFSQSGNEFLWDAPVLDVNAASVTTTASLIAMSVPLGIKVNVIINGTATGGTGYSLLFTSPDVADTATTLNGIQTVTSYQGITGAGFTNLSIRTNTSSQIRARAGNSTATVYITTMGWVDTRGRDA